MWKYMESAQPAVFVKNYEQGIKRVKKGNYAFLMESTVLDYVVQVGCPRANFKKEVQAETLRLYYRR
jgi:hypothetical protein